MASISPLHGGLVWKNKTHSKKTGLNFNDFAFLKPGADSSIKEEEEKKGRDVNEFFDPQPSKLSMEQKVNLITSVGQQIIKPQEIPSLLTRKPQFTCYDGFQPSGRMHIAQGILKSINVNKMTKAGGIFIFWVADWFALMNNKMGGDMYKIRKLGEYFIEVWKAAGMDLRNVKFLWAADHINSRSQEYWGMVLDIARRFSLNRIKKCGQIMGRQNEDQLSPAQIIYPCMQCTDIFFLGADICQLGLDQVKVNALAREYCQIRKDIKHPPIIVSHHMLMGLKQGQAKMSKSDPDSAIFMQDPPQAVNTKINKKAYCAPGDIKNNPVLDYAKNLVFQRYGQCLVEREEKNGGNKLYKSYEEMKSDFQKQLLHPGDLKKAVAKNINQMLEPIRKHFVQDPYAKQLLAEIKSWK